MALIIVLTGIILLIALILLKVNPMLALLIVSIITGLLLQMPLNKVVASVNNGIGNTLGGTVMILALGAMLGKLAEESGAGQKLVLALVKLFGRKYIAWAVLLTGLIAGIPLFYNAGFVILIPLVFAISTTLNYPLLMLGIPMAAALSITHGFLPPHPGPVTLATIFHANVGKTLLYGLLISIPTAIIAGIVFPKLVKAGNIKVQPNINFSLKESTGLPSLSKSIFILLSPVIFISCGTLGVYFTSNAMALNLLAFLQDPTIALLLSLGLTFVLLRWNINRFMSTGIEGVKAITMILLIIAAGGAFKQILLDSNIGVILKNYTDTMHLSPLFLGWLIAALFRISLGSATVAALSASGIVSPFITGGISAELMVLSVGAGSLMCSHVNDTGFWMFKEYFGLNLKDTFRTWTLMESLISLLGLLFILGIQAFFG
jgi:Gnt-I system high-affinity gluconate transporter